MYQASFVRLVHLVLLEPLRDLRKGGSMPVTPHVTDEARTSLQRLVDRSRRRTGLQLPGTFARGTPRNPAPLPLMLRGGRGGTVRLKLYLSTALLAGSGHSHPTLGTNTVANVSAPAWARALALPDPDNKGARRIADAQTWLHNARLLSVKRRPGAEPIVRLLSGDGAGRAWSRPTTPYITVPIELWECRWIWLLSGKGLAVLIALLDLQSGRGADGKAEPQWMSKEQRDRYGLSDDTWRLATAELEALRLVQVTRGERVRYDFETPRRRNKYWVDLSRMHETPLESL